MKAAVIHGPHKITCDNVDDPKLKGERDIILKVTATAICGSDLHMYSEPGGNCFFCRHDLPGHCEHSNPKYGPEGALMDRKGGALFGYSDLYGGYDGGQAQYVRVPYADYGSRKVPDALSDEEVLVVDACMSAVRRGGTVSILGGYGTTYDNFPLGQMFDKGLNIKCGQAPAHKYADELLKLVAERKVRLDDIITRRLPLTQIEHAYEIFQKKEDNCVKVLLDPWA